jgi:hypothetical protein
MLRFSRRQEYTGPPRKASARRLDGGGAVYFNFVNVPLRGTAAICATLRARRNRG